MNATPMNPTSGNTVQPASKTGKPADSGAQGMPFSQVLSSEMGQNRKTDTPQENSNANAKPDPDPASQPAQAAGNRTDSAQQAKAGEKPEQGGDKDDTASTEDATVAPETFLGLAISPDAFKPMTAAIGTRAVAAETVAAETVAVETVATDTATSKAAADRNAVALGAPGDPATSARDTRKGRAIPGTQAAQQADNQQGKQKIESRLAGKEDLRAAATTRPAAPADTAAAFQGQLAAVRHTDRVKTGETLSDLVNSPAMRIASHAPVDAPLAAADTSGSRLAPTVGTTAWGQALGEKLVWMASGTQQTATLTLNPPNLGPLQIVVHVTNDQATASFFSAQPDVRHALESAFPRLREMMNDAGIQLGQTTVSADTPQQNNTPDRQPQRITLPFSGADHAAPAALQAVQAPVRQSGRGLVDTFA
ncbi:flagellar hook-length control protein FliK [Thiobacillus sp.]